VECFRYFLIPSDAFDPFSCLGRDQIRHDICCLLRQHLLPWPGPNVQAGPPQVSSTLPSPSYNLLPFPMPHLFPRAGSAANDLTARIQLCKLHAGRCASSDNPSWRIRDGDREKEFRQ